MAIQNMEDINLPTLFSCLYIRQNLTKRFLPNMHQETMQIASLLQSNIQANVNLIKFSWFGKGWLCVAQIDQVCSVRYKIS